MLTFEPDGHIYRWNGEIVSGVTDSLNAVMDKTWMTEEGRERGKAVHALTQAIDEGTYEDWMCPLTLEPYVRAYRAFLAEFTPKWIGIEELVFNEFHRYAGTLDRRGWLDRRNSSEYCVLDIKTGEYHSAHALQLSAYTAAAPKELSCPEPARYVLLLRTDGTYRLREIRTKGREDWAVFLSLLNVARWKERNGI